MASHGRHGLSAVVLGSVIVKVLTTAISPFWSIDNVVPVGHCSISIIEEAPQ
jgi:hypothetical protein